MTEEGIRNLVGDMKMPKDALAFLLAQADKTRSEVARVVTHESALLEGERCGGDLEAAHRGDAGGERHHPAQAQRRAGFKARSSTEEEPDEGDA